MKQPRSRDLGALRRDFAEPGEVFGRQHITHSGNAVATCFRHTKHKRSCYEKANQCKTLLRVFAFVHLNLKHPEAMP